MCHLLFGKKGWHLAMKTRRCDLIEHGVRTHAFTPQKLEIGPQSGEFSRHGGAFEPALMQFRQVGANGMMVDGGHGGAYGWWRDLGLRPRTVRQKREELCKVAPVGIQGMR
jgi:hypothetical protein